jgi:hypothetical protein
MNWKGKGKFDGILILIAFIWYILFSNRSSGIMRMAQKKLDIAIDPL